MVRIKPVTDDDERAVRHGLFSTFAAEGREPIALYRTLANHPDALIAYRALPQMLRHHATTPRRLRELAVLRVAQLLGSEYEWSHHRPMAVTAGVTEEQIRTLASWHSAEVFDSSERAVLTAVESLHELRLSDGEFAHLAEALGEMGAIEIVVAVAQYEATARIIQGLGVEVEPIYHRHLADWHRAQQDTSRDYSHSGAREEPRTMP